MSPARIVSRDRFVEIVKQMAVKHRRVLDERRKRAADPDHREIWVSIIRSLATYGRSEGAKGMATPEARERLAYRVLVPLSVAQRMRRAEPVFAKAGVRWAPKKARFLAENVDIVREHGGPAALDAKIDGASSKEEVIDLLKTLYGFGPKYARNLPMDRCHPRFEDSIAIDARIDSIARALGMAELGYHEKEKRFLEIAGRAGVSGWDLDRLLYNCTDDFKAAMGIPTRKPRAPRPDC